MNWMMKGILLLSVVQGWSHSMATDVQKDDSYQHYNAVPFNLDHLGGLQYFHIHITGTGDTKVKITLHGTYLFRVASLDRTNDWAWHENIYISADLQTAAYSRGFHIVADQPVTILLTRNCTVSQSLLTYTAFPMSSRLNEQYIIGSYPSYTSRWKSALLVGTGESSTRINVYGPASATNTLSNLTVADYTVYQYLLTKPRNVVGFTVVSSAQAAVFGGHQRTYLPFNIKTAFVPVFYQIPPLDHVGKAYMVGPLSGRLSPGYYSLFIVLCHNNSSVSITHNMAESGVTVTQASSSHCVCQYNVTGTCLVDCHINLMTGSYLEIRVADVKESVLVSCSEACLLFTVMHSYAIRSHLSIGGSMALVAPARSAPTGFHFFVPSVTGTVEIQQTWINIAVPSLAIDGVFIDGIRLIDVKRLVKFRENRVFNWTVVSLYVEPGNHRVSHEDSDHVPLSVHVYGTVIPQLLNVATGSTFGYPVSYPGPMVLTGHFHVKQPANNEEKSTCVIQGNKGNSYGLLVVICIIVVTVFLGVLTVILIVIRNAAFLRVLLEYMQPEIPPDSMHTEWTEKEKACLETDVCAPRDKTKDDVELYLLPSSSKPRYVKQNIKHTAVSTPDQEEMHNVDIPLPELPIDEDDNYDNIMIS